MIVPLDMPDGRLNGAHRSVIKYNIHQLPPIRLPHTLLGKKARTFLLFDSFQRSPVYEFTSVWGFASFIQEDLRVGQSHVQELFHQIKGPGFSMLRHGAFKHFKIFLSLLQAVRNCAAVSMGCWSQDGNRVLHMKIPATFVFPRS